MSTPDPVLCCRCPARALYKINEKGFCATHKPGGIWIDEVTVMVRYLGKRHCAADVELEPLAIVEFDAEVPNVEAEEKARTKTPPRQD